MYANKTMHDINWIEAEKKLHIEENLQNKCMETVKIYYKI